VFLQAQLPEPAPGVLGELADAGEERREESIEQLKSMDNNNALTFQGDQFVFVPDNKFLVCITTHQNLKCI